MAQRLRFDIRQAGRQLLLALGALALLNAGFYLFYTRPAVLEYASLLKSEAGRDKVDERKDQVEKRETFLAGLNQADQDLQHLRDEILSTRDERLVEVQLEVAELARQFNIDLDSVNYSSERLLDEELDRLVMTMPLEGGYPALRKFLQAVEQSDKFLLVERVALAKGKEGGVMLQLNITLATYFNLPQELLDLKRQQAGRGRARGA